MLIRWAPALGLLDMPSERKVHSRPVPRGGGIAVIAAVFIVLWTFPYEPYNDLLDRSWVCAGLVALFGLADDLRPLPWLLRLGAQTIIAIVAVVGSLSPLSGWVQGAAVIWLVALTNAFNMLDNMDTLSGGVALIDAGFLLLALGEPGGLAYAVLLAALVGFLWFNWPPARIFLGDVGSTFLGFLIGYGALRVALQPDGPAWASLIALCLCAVPIYDQGTVVLLRLSQGRSPFHADKQHLSHRLVGAGGRRRGRWGSFTCWRWSVGVRGCYCMP